MNVNSIFSPQEIQELKTQWYDDQQIQQAILEASQELNQPQGAVAGSQLQQSYLQSQQFRNADPRAGASNSFISGGYNENLIQWQLELDTILERIEHMLRGDKPECKNGSVIWTPPKDDDERIFNERGVAELMRALSNYVNRNTILSNYTEEIIDTKMLDVGYELSDLIYLKYEVFGLDSLEKRKLYPMIVREMVDIVHSAYLRALNGGERESLREARTVNQTEAFSPQGININTSNQGRERGWLNPLRWIGTKTK